MASNAEFRAKVTVDGADKAADQLEKVADAGADLEGTAIKVPVKADTKAAERDIAGLMSKVDKLGGDAATILLTSNATKIAGEMADLIIDLDRLDANDPEVTIKSDQINKLQGDLDQIETKIKDVNATSVTLDTSGSTKGLDDMVTGADQANSAVANMVGNSAQDMGELAGVTGSAGVAVGQLAEYFTDSAFKAKAAGQGFGEIFKSFASAAGPIAAITGAIFLVTAAAEAFGAPAKAAEARTKALGDAMDGASDPTLAFAQVLRDSVDDLSHFNAAGTETFGSVGVAADAMLDKIPLIGSLFHDAGVNVYDAMSKAGLSIYDMSKAMDEGGAAADAFNVQLLAAKEAGLISGDEYATVSEALDKYSESAGQAAKNAGLLNVSADEANAILGDLKKTTDPLAQSADGAGEAWAALFTDMQDGNITTKAAADAINFLSENLGISREEVVKLAQTNLDENMQKTAEATKQAAEAAREYASVLAGTDWGESAAAGAATAWQQLGESQFAITNIAADTQAAYDSLGQSIKDNGFNFDIATEKGRANGEQIQNLYSSLIPKLSAAFVDAGGSVDSFGANMDTLRSEVFAGLDSQTSLTADQINAVIDQLGVFDGSKYSSQFELLGTEDANAKLALLSGVIGSLPDEVQKQVTLAVLAGDPQAALDVIATEVGAPGAAGTATVMVDADTGPAASTVYDFVGDDYSTTVTTEANVKPATGTVNTFTGTARQATPIGVDANIRAALFQINLISLLTALARPVVNIDANISSALAALNRLQATTVRPPVDAYLRDYPTAGEIAARIGVVRVPVDAYVRTTPRITGLGL